MKHTLSRWSGSSISLFFPLTRALSRDSLPSCVWVNFAAGKTDVRRRKEMRFETSSTWWLFATSLILCAPFWLNLPLRVIFTRVAISTHFAFPIFTEHSGHLGTWLFACAYGFFT